MKVLVIFEFENIEDPNSPEADAKVQAITEDCETMQVAFDASGCWVQEVFGGDLPTEEVGDPDSFVFNPERDGPTEFVPPRSLTIAEMAQVLNMRTQRSNDEHGLDKV